MKRKKRKHCASTGSPRVPLSLWVGSPSIVNTTALNLAGAALYGTYGVADYAVDATPASKAFGAAYQAHLASLGL